MRPVDYGLIYRLEDERFAREKAYVCPFWDWIKDFRDKFIEQSSREQPWAAPWWERIPKSDKNGTVMHYEGTKGRAWRELDECSGEIDWR